MTLPTWVAIDVAAEALNTTPKYAYELSKRDNWRHDGQRPRHFHIDDIRTTWKNRQPTPNPKEPQP